MKTAELLSINGHQMVKLPEEFRFPDGQVTIRKQGDWVILEPTRAEQWPAGFFNSIQIDNPNFERPPQLFSHNLC